MAKLTLASVSNLLGSPTAAATTINNNSDLTAAALENTLSRDGSTPNTMSADLDMNHNDILNVGIISADDFTIGGASPEGALTAAQAAATSATASALSASQSAAQALNAAALARNDVSYVAYSGDGVTTDYPLLVDPGSNNNITVNFNGATQLNTSFNLIYVSTVPTVRFTAPPPADVVFEIKTGYRLTVGTPGLGTVTYPTIQNISATSRLLGRKTAGAGTVEEITLSDLRDLFLPAGSVVDSVSGVYTASTALAVAIPGDDTVPQVTEGTQVISIALTPKTVTNKFRVRYSGFGALDAVGGWCFAAFVNGGANAAHACQTNTPTANYTGCLSGEFEFTPGSTTAQAITLRAGPGSTGNLWLNGKAGRSFGGVAGVRMTIEEIKA